MRRIENTISWEPASDYLSTSVRHPYEVYDLCHHSKLFAETLFGCTCYHVRAHHLGAC